MHVHKFTIVGIATAVYVFLAVGFVRADRQSHSGGFINLQGMMSALITLPVSFPLEYWGRRINYRSNAEMAGAIITCGLLFFGLSLGIARLADFVWNWNPAQR